MAARGKIYFFDTFKFEHTATVQCVVDIPLGGKGPNRPAIVLCETIFHPQGGGQPSDVGTLSTTDGFTVKVSAVRSLPETGEIAHFVEPCAVRSLPETGEIAHFVEPCGPEEVIDGDTNNSFVGTLKARLVDGSTVKQSVDRDTRIFHARLHTGGHLLDAAVLRAGLSHWITAKGYHFPDGPNVEYIVEPPPTPEERVQLVGRIQHAVDELLDDPQYVDYTTRNNVPVEEAAALLPSALDPASPAIVDGTVRVVTIGGLGCMCGGTHVPSAKLLGRVLVKKLTAKKNVVKVAYSLESGE